MKKKILIFVFLGMILLAQSVQAAIDIQWPSGVTTRYTSIYEVDNVNHTVVDFYSDGSWTGAIIGSDGLPLAYVYQDSFGTVSYSYDGLTWNFWYQAY